MIENKVLKAIKDYNMLKKSNKVTVALSGGADSVCLLHALYSLKDRLKIELSAAHLNHMIRGVEAERDQSFVEQLCKKMGILLFAEKIDVPQYAKDNSMSLELAARKVRYDFLRRVSGGLIATAHNSGDNLETVLFNLTRGTALKGLCGIPPVREDIIRPLIYCSRAEIEDYCKTNGLDFVTDSTNLSDDYTRNKIRHNIVPELRELNPAVEEAVIRMGEALSLDNDFLEKTVSSELEVRVTEEKKLCLDKFSKLHEAIALRLLKRFTDLCGVDGISNSHLKQLYNICISGGEVSLPGCVFISESGKLYKNCCEDKKAVFSVKIASVEVEELINAKKINNLLLKNYIDCDKIVGKLVVRTRKSGDTIKLKNKNGTKPLTKVYNEYRVPVGIRDSLPLICDDAGVVWIYKIGVAERCAANSNSKRISKITVIEGLENNNAT